MKNTIKKIAFLFTFVILMMLFAMSANALNTTGQCGDNAYWNFNNETGELVISGEGEMYNYINKNPSPFEASSEIKSIVIEEGITYVGTCAFRFCEELEKVTIADTVTVINEMAFSFCIKLTDVDLSENLELLGQMAFLWCTSLEEITLPNSMKGICMDSSAFYNCINLKKIVLPEELTEILPSTFENCVSLENIIIPSNVTSIDSSAFCACTNLKTINLPNGLLEIGNSAFEMCTSLEEIKIPSSIKNIESGVFAYCFSLTEVILPESIEHIDNSCFYSCFSLQKVICENPNMVFNGEEIFNKDYILNEDVTLEDLAEKNAKFIYFVMEAYGIYHADEEEVMANCGEKLSALEEELESCKVYLDESEPITDLVLYGHTHSTTETYAIEKNIPFVRIDEAYHPDIYFTDEWVYDYDNMIRYRECTFAKCSERIEEPLESTNNGDVEIIEPVDPDTDFEVEEVKGDNFILVEEKVSNGTEGNVEVLKAFDINLKNHDGVHVQPDGTVKVKLPNDWSKKGVYKIYLVNDDGTLTDMNAYRQGSHLVFETDHFSIYVIVVENEETEPEAPEVPAEPDTSDCKCICHKGGVLELLAIVFRFVVKLLGVFPTCDCGVAHY